MKKSRNSSPVEGRKARLGRSLKKQNSGVRSQESECWLLMPRLSCRDWSPRDDHPIEGYSRLRNIWVEVQIPLFVFERLALAVFQALGWRRRTHLQAGQALDFFGSAKRLRFSRLGGAHRRGLAEVCRNRTDRSRIAGPAGFEAPDGHQPACTSGLILDEGNLGVNLEGGQKHKRRVAARQQLAPREEWRYFYFVRVNWNGIRQSP